MLGREVLLYLNTGMVEPVLCWDFKIGMDGGEPSIMHRISGKEMYVVPLRKIHHFEVHFVWLFDDDYFDPHFFSPPPPPFLV